ncbi:MAG: flagellar M-ring protein FliF C-terminal domain-containing protein [Candidatus Gastranaerophilaceae bacterium]
MDINNILENKPLLYGLIGGAVLIIAVVIISVAIAANGNKNENNTVGGEPLKTNVDLLTTDNLGKALEIQALLAKQGITAERSLEGTKSKLYLNAKNCSTLTKKCTITDRDNALIAIVQSGLVDQNVGLEIFDKGDFTSTKEDKRIRLARAMNGELARLIKQIKPIQNATVFISIPENNGYFENPKPKTATVQIVMPSGKDYEKLDQIKVKAIINLLVGSVSGLKAENISITDTNGNVYRSVMDAEDEMLQRLEENDKYMQQKISKQLDRLFGPGNYVVTVSTFLRQTPVEKFTIEYDPTKKASVSEQSFREGLGDQTKDQSQGINAVSTYLPNGLPSGGTDSSQSRNYSRSATETQYGVTKTQTNEYIKPGVIEDISIAVTVDRNNWPAETTQEELKELIARAASPKVTAEDVSIAYSNSNDPYLTPDKQQNLPKPDESGNPWWLALLLCGLGLIIIFKAISAKVKKIKEENQIEVEQLRQKTLEQERQLSDINSRASQLTQRQSELAQDLINQQQRVAIPQFDESLLVDSLESISSEITEDSADKIKSWIEEGSKQEG